MSRMSTRKLSDIVQDAVHESQNVVSPIKMKQLSYIIGQVKTAPQCLCNQMIKKMKLYNNTMISDREMMNCLILIEYLVDNQPKFRGEVSEIDFIYSLEMIGKMKKKSGKLTDVEFMVRHLISTWATNYPEELSEYNVMYLKYCQNGSITIPDLNGFDIPQDVQLLKKKISNKEKKIHNAIDNNSGNLESLYRESLKLCMKFNKRLEELQVEKRYDETKLNSYLDYANKFTLLNEELSNKIFVEDRLKIVIDTSKLENRPMKKHFFRKKNTLKQRLLSTSDMNTNDTHQDMNDMNQDMSHLKKPIQSACESIHSTTTTIPQTPVVELQEPKENNVKPTPAFMFNEDELNFI